MNKKRFWWSFQSRIQFPFFMCGWEYLADGKIVYADILFQTDWAFKRWGIITLTQWMNEGINEN